MFLFVIYEQIRPCVFYLLSISNKIWSISALKKTLNFVFLLILNLFCLIE